MKILLLAVAGFALSAAPFGTCSVSVGTQTVTGTTACNLNIHPDVTLSAGNHKDSVALNFYVNPYAGITALSVQSSLYQDEEIYQVITGGTGDAILKMNYRWAYHFGYGDPNWQSVAYSTNDPLFSFNGAPIAAGIKEDFTGGDSCSFCHLFVFPVEMPITFGVPFSRGWNHTMSAEYSFKNQWPFGLHFVWAGGMRETARVTSIPDYRPFMQVFAGGEPVAFQVQDIENPEPAGFVLTGIGFAALIMVRRYRATRACIAPPVAR